MQKLEPVLISLFYLFQKQKPNVKERENTRILITRGTE